MFIIPIDPTRRMPIYEQIYEYLAEQIKSGYFEVRTKLPSTRSLATELQVSRSTVELAYDQLLSEGYIESVPKSGYYVCAIGELISIPKEKIQLDQKFCDMEQKILYDFSPFAVDISSFPFNTWRKLSNKCMNDLNKSIFLLGENQGDAGLRKAISKYLHESRGVKCRTEQIVIGAGADYLLQLLSQLLTKNAVVAMENPVYMRACHILRGMGLKVIPISVEKEGISIPVLCQSNADIAYVTPSHQYPLGIVMPIKQRIELLDWAAEKNSRYIIEDDHDSEFRYKGKPIPSLQGIDQKERVIYLGTFSRAIAPAIRIGYMVLPEALLEKYNNEFFYYSSTVSRVDQAIIREFIEGGYFERHVNKMRKRYKGKHDIMLKALKIFGRDIIITGENAGLYLVIELLKETSEELLLKKALDHGIRLYGLEQYYIDKTELYPPKILLGFANLAEQEIVDGIRRLYDILT